MSYYDKTKVDLLKKVHDKYHNGCRKGEAAKYYHKNKELI